MRKIAFVILLAGSLSACSTIQNFHQKAAVYVCAHKADLIASATALNDTAAINAINAYCPEPVAGASN